MKGLNRKSILYILSTTVVGVFLLIYNLFKFDFDLIWFTITIGLLASASLVFKVEGATNRSHYNISFLIFAFTLILLGPEAAILVIVVSNVVEWAWYRYSWYIPVFNTCSLILVMHLAGMFHDFMNGYGPHTGLTDIAIELATLALFTIGNHLMVGLVIWFARGENFSQSGVFSGFSLMLDFILLCMGAGTALLWMFNPFSIVLVLLPLYLIYTTLKVPALERQTEIDPKTGIYNARYFEQALASELGRANRFDRPMTVVMADLDLLRNINNTFGHLAGDDVLIGIANLLKNNVRDYDVVARFGGEEFSILLPETEPEEAALHVEQLRKLIESTEFTIQTSLEPIRVTMSFGIAGRESFDQAPKDIIHKADTALYHSKLRGRNRVYVNSRDNYFDLFIKENESDKGRSLPSNGKSEHLPATDLTTPDDHTIGNCDELEAASIKSRDEQADRKKQVDSPKLKALDSQHIHTKPKLPVRWFITGLFLLACAPMVLWFPYLTSPNWLYLGAFVLIVVMTEWLSIDIYVRDSAVSTSAVPMVAGFLIFGPAGVVVLSFSIALVAMIKHRSRLESFFFNMSNHVIAGILCTGLVALTGLPFMDLQPAQQFIIGIAAGGIVYLCTTFLIAMGMWLDTGISIREIWVEKYSWLAPYYLGVGVIAYSLVMSFIMANLIGIFVLIAPLLLLRLSQVQYLQRTKIVVQELREKNMALQESSDEITRLNEGLLHTLAEVVDLRDPYVMGHSKQVASLAEKLGQKLGLNAKQLQKLHKAGLLHDIGKLGISESILFKPGKLTAIEYEIIKNHSVLGAEILENSHALHDLIPVVRHHHEHYDGSGYPDGLSGNQIPIEARIIGVADAVEAMSSDRHYRRGRTLPQVIGELDQYAGTQFDPQVVTAFNEIVEAHGGHLITNSARIIKNTDEREERQPMVASIQPAISFPE